MLVGGLDLKIKEEFNHIAIPPREPETWLGQSLQSARRISQFLAVFLVNGFSSATQEFLPPTLRRQVRKPVMPLRELQGLAARGIPAAVI